LADKLLLLASGLHDARLHMQLTTVEDFNAAYAEIDMSYRRLLRVFSATVCVRPYCAPYYREALDESVSVTSCALEQYACRRVRMRDSGGGGLSLGGSV